MIVNACVRACVCLCVCVSFVRACACVRACMWSRTGTRPISVSAFMGDCAALPSDSPFSVLQSALCRRASFRHDIYETVLRSGDYSSPSSVTTTSESKVKALRNIFTCAGEPTPGADVAGVSPLPAQMWQGRAQVRNRCGRGRVEPSPGANVAGGGPSPGKKCGRGDPSLGADVAGVGCGSGKTQSRRLVPAADGERACTCACACAYA